MGVVLIIFVSNQHISIFQFVIFAEQQITKELYEVQPAWHQVLVVAAHQTICRDKTKMRTFFNLPIASCSTLMLNAILAIGTSERRTDSLVRIRIYHEQVFPMETLAFDRPFVQGCSYFSNSVGQKVYLMSFSSIKLSCSKFPNKYRFIIAIE